MQNDHIWRPHGVIIDLRDEFQVCSKIDSKLILHIKIAFRGQIQVLKLVGDCSETQNGNILETPRGNY